MTSAPPAPKVYRNVFLLLLGFVALTCALSFVDLGRLSTPVALFISIAKAVLIISYFMHAKSGPGRLWVFAAAGFVWFAILLALTFGDYVTRRPEARQVPLRGLPADMLAFFCDRTRTPDQTINEAAGQLCGTERKW